MINKDFLEYLLKISSISKIGLLYSKDLYAIENYQEIQELTTEMLESFQEVNINRHNYFKRDIYPTPNIAVRALLIKDDQVLLVQESEDLTYSFPGGWCDLYDTPSEAIKKEFLQEAGYVVEVERLLAILDRKRDPSSDGLSEYTIWFVVKEVSKTSSHTHETVDVRFFNLDKLPVMSFKTTEKEIEKIIEAYKQNKTIFD